MRPIAVREHGERCPHISKEECDSPGTNHHRRSQQFHLSIRTPERHGHPLLRVDVHLGSSETRQHQSEKSLEFLLGWISMLINVEPKLMSIPTDSRIAKNMPRTFLIVVNWA
jgi:hypothetical protein